MNEGYAGHAEGQQQAEETDRRRQEDEHQLHGRSKPMAFTPATRRKSRLRLALSGPSGSGKTFSALQIARGLGGKIAVIDTEHGSASLYSHIAEFDTLELAPPFSPERYIEAMKAAEQAGYSTVIVDSITHEWNGSGGLLEIVEQLAQTKFRGNSYAAWATGTPRHRAFLEAMLQSKCHVIATMRSKTAYVEGEKSGKKSYVKAGMAPEQRDGVEYEFTLVLDLNNDGHLAMASKDRTGLFSERDPFLITPDIGEEIRRYLDSGEVSRIEEFIQKASTIQSEDEGMALYSVALDDCKRRIDRDGMARFKQALKERFAALGVDSGG